MSDAEYTIIKEMAAVLVPDVCRIIMEFLEQIHIDLGRQRWNIVMGKLNIEYKTIFIPDILDDSKEFYYFVHAPLLPFKFNYREIKYYNFYSSVFNIRKSTSKWYFGHPGIGILPENYFYARLYVD
jgi:hypothetical protein